MCIFVLWFELIEQHISYCLCLCWWNICLVWDSRAITINSNNVQQLWQWFYTTWKNNKLNTLCHTNTKYYLNFFALDLFVKFCTSQVEFRMHVCLKLKKQNEMFAVCLFVFCLWHIVTTKNKNKNTAKKKEREQNNHITK